MSLIWLNDYFSKPIVWFLFGINELTKKSHEQWIRSHDWQDSGGSWSTQLEKCLECITFPLIVSGELLKNNHDVIGRIRSKKCRKLFWKSATIFVADISGSCNWDGVLSPLGKKLRNIGHFFDRFSSLNFIRFSSSTPTMTGFRSMENVFVNWYVDWVWLFHWNWNMFFDGYWHWFLDRYRNYFLNRIRHLLLDCHRNRFYHWYCNRMCNWHVDRIWLCNAYGYWMRYLYCHWLSDRHTFNNNKRKIIQNLKIKFHHFSSKIRKTNKKTIKNLINYVNDAEKCFFFPWDTSEKNDDEKWNI